MSYLGCCACGGRGLGAFDFAVEDAGDGSDGGGGFTYTHDADPERGPVPSGFNSWEEYDAWRASVSPGGSGVTAIVESYTVKAGSVAAEPAPAPSGGGGFTWGGNAELLVTTDQPADTGGAQIPTVTDPASGEVRPWGAQDVRTTYTPAELVDTEAGFGIVGWLLGFVVAAALTGR